MTCYRSFHGGTAGKVLSYDESAEDGSEMHEAHDVHFVTRMNRQEGQRLETWGLRLET